MSRALLVLYNDDMRKRAVKFIMAAPSETRVTFQGPRRTLPQNDRMWAMLSDIAVQKDHYGRKYTPEEWKTLMMSALGREMKFVPSLDGSGFVPLGHSSSNLSVAEMAELITFMEAWGAYNDVHFKSFGEGFMPSSPRKARDGFPVTKGSEVPAGASSRPPFDENFPPHGSAAERRYARAQKTIDEVDEP